MILYYSTTDKSFLNRNVYDGTFNPSSDKPVFFENDIVDMAVQFLQANTSSVLNAYSVITPAQANITMSIGLGMPDPVSPLVIDSKQFFYDSVTQTWTGSLTLTGSNIQTLMNAGSSSYLEIQESSTSPTYVYTYVQQEVVLMSDIAKP